MSNLFKRIITYGSLTCSKCRRYLPGTVDWSDGGEEPCFQLACSRSADFKPGPSKSGNCTCFLEPLRDPANADDPVPVAFVGLCVGDAGSVAGRLELKQLVPVGWHVYLTGDIWKRSDKNCTGSWYGYAKRLPLNTKSSRHFFHLINCTP